MNKWCAVVLMIIFSYANAALCSGKTVLLSPGDQFPNLVLPDVLEKPDKQYLGISIPFFSFSKKSTFHLDEIDAEIIFVEFFNKYCTSCQLQAPVNNEIYKYVTADPVMRKQVKFIGIGAGNSLCEVNSFKSEKNILFPLLPDQDFNGYEAIGDPGGTPYMLIIRKTGSAFTVVSAHMGLHKDMDYWVKQLQYALNTDIDDLKKIKTRVDLKSESRILEMSLTREEMIKHAQISMRAALAGQPDASDLSVHAVDGFKNLFKTEWTSGDRKSVLYAKFISRKPVCDVCHGIHFMVTFDSDGIIRNVHAIHLTKYGNVIWDETDIAKINKSLVGKKIDASLNFDSQVDAVTTATMTTSLIYNSVKRMEALIQKLD